MLSGVSFSNEDNNNNNKSNKNKNGNSYFCHLLTFFGITNDNALLCVMNQYVKTSVSKIEIGMLPYLVITYSLLKGKKSEDDIYGEEKELQYILPRACTLLVSTTNDIVASLMGPAKFSGYKPIDEDTDQTSHSTIFDYSTIKEWAINGNLEVVETTKENGKFWIVKLVIINDILCLFTGTKNNHTIFPIEEIDIVIDAQPIDSILRTGLLYIKQCVPRLINLLNVFNDGYSLVGELHDNQHFVLKEDNNVITFFGFFKHGNAMDTKDAYQLIIQSGLQSVEYRVIFTPDSNYETLDDIFLLSQCRKDEGIVFYCRNVETNKVILVKSKSVVYIVKRMMREILKNGYANIENIINRIVDTSTYHGLNTHAATRVTKQLINFGKWMIFKQFPCSILGHMPVESVRGQLCNGFAIYWDLYLKDKNTDINITPDDFGPFDEATFRMQTTRPKRKTTDPVYVFFIQGLQGSGKSTTAKILQTSNYLKCFEQDWYYGCSKSCMGAIHEEIINPFGAKVIIITRCNINEEHYKHYVSMIHKLNCCNISFIAHENVNMLYLTVSLSGVLKRKTIGDQIMVGRFEADFIDAVGFVRKNYESFQKHPLAWTVSIYNSNDKLLQKANQLKTNDEIKNFVEENHIELEALRLSPYKIASNIFDFIKHTQYISYDKSKFVYNLKPLFVGGRVWESHQKELLQFVHNLYNYNAPLRNMHTDLSKACDEFIKSIPLKLFPFGLSCIDKELFFKKIHKIKETHLRDIYFDFLSHDYGEFLNNRFMNLLKLEEKEYKIIVDKMEKIIEMYDYNDIGFPEMVRCDGTVKSSINLHQYEWETDEEHASRLADNFESYALTCKKSIELYDTIAYKSIINNEFVEYCEHLTINYLGGKTEYIGSLKPGTIVSAIIDALVIRKKDGACAFRVSSVKYKNVEIDMKGRQAHITAIIPSSQRPSCSNSFVGLTDQEIVTVIPYCHHLQLSVFYHS